MGLTSAKVRLQLDRRFAALSGKAKSSFGQQAGETCSEVGAREERLGILILTTSLARSDERQVSCKLGLGHASRSDIVVGSHEVAPRSQTGLWLPLGWGLRSLATLRPSFALNHLTHQAFTELLNLEPVVLIAEGLEETLCGVEMAKCVV